MSDDTSRMAQLDSERRRVDVDNLTITVRELLSMSEQGELRRAPAYQRKFIWDEEAESRLIESVLLGLPIPNLFFATNTDGTWEIVDGLQRLSTLIHFAAPSEQLIAEIGKEEVLRLVNLKNLSEFNGLVYEDLTPAMQMHFVKRGLGVTALSDKSDPSTRFDTFERLNRGAVQLTPQEVRACIYQGSFNELLRDLAYQPSFYKLVKLAKGQEDNATREELVLKFFAYRDSRDKFKGAVTEFLNDYMDSVAETFDVEGGRMAFLRVVGELSAIIDGPFLREKTSVTPQNQLEAVLLGADQVIREYGQLGKPDPDWLEDESLVENSTGATNTRAKLTGRIARAAELLSPAKQ